jgi:protein tyrosine phosphatase
MSGGSPNIPSWLRVAQSSSRANVLHTLAKRERQRDSARTLSRHRSNPSKAYHFIALQNTELADHYSVCAGHKNQWGNRYLNLEPYDRTRVVVDVAGEQCDMGTDHAPCGQGRYLNASWVRELYGSKWWIATQAPLPTTAHAFLSVILQPVTRPPQLLDPSLTSRPCRIRTVVQLTQNVESGRQKAHAYFPDTDGQSWVVSPEKGASDPSIKVTLLETRTIPEIHCIQSTVSVVPISSTNEEQEPVTFRHMMYSAWPDHGVPEPEDEASLLAFIRLVDQTNTDTSSQLHSSDLHPDPPVMVNCSAGIGRTGSFIALSSLLRGYNILVPGRNVLTTLAPVSSRPASPLGPLPNDFKDDLVAQEVDWLREQRPGMVQRDEQIMLIYDVLATAFS